MEETELTRPPASRPAPEPVELDPVDQAVRLMALRVVGAHRPRRNTERRDRDRIEILASLLGWTEARVEKARGETLARAIADRQQALAPASVLDQRGSFGHNLRLLAAEVGLSEIETKLVALAALLTSHAVLQDALAGVPMRTRAESLAVLGSALAEPQAELARALDPSATLARSGVLQFEPGTDGYLSRFSNPLELLEGLGASLLGERWTCSELHRRYARPARAPALSLADFDYLRRETRLLRDLLRAAVEHREPGVNVLLHGAPGTGKTELARLLAAESGAAALEVEHADKDDDAMAPKMRLRSFALCQKLLAGASGRVLIFDEIEEVLGGSTRALWVDDDFDLPARGKAWKGRLLEENPVPAIWIGNTVRVLDPALQRRFSYILHVPVPARAGRMRMLESALSAFAIAPSAMARVADSDRVTPADIQRTRRLLTLQPPRDGAEATERFLLTIGSRPGGVDTSAMLDRITLAELAYNAAWLNTDPPLAEVVAQLAARGWGRLCFFGPPGTGKTAFAKHLAGALDRPLLVRRASDLLSCFLGETEHNIARCFRDAQRDRALLLLDEADSFLQDRSGAERSWEISQVNEFLKQLEDYEGCVALSTNFFESLDRAVLRRLDLKVGFRYLRREIVPEVAAAAARVLGLELDVREPRVKAALAALSPLALGDVAAALRQALLRAALPTVDTLLAALTAEVRLRAEHGSRPIGFVKPSG